MSTLWYCTSISNWHLMCLNNRFPLTYLSPCSIGMICFPHLSANETQRTDGNGNGKSQTVKSTRGQCGMEQSLNTHWAERWGFVSMYTTSTGCYSSAYFNTHIVAVQYKYSLPKPGDIFTFSEHPLSWSINVVSLKYHTQH